MPARTTNYNFLRPTVRGDGNQWGIQLNGNWNSMDGLLLGVQTSFYGAVTPALPTDPNTKKGTFWFNTTNEVTTGLVPLTVWDGTVFVTIGDLDPTEHIFSIPGASFLVGQISPYAGIDLTHQVPLWRFCNGEAISRTTYLALFEKITQTFTGTTDGATAVILVANTANLQTGWFISGNGIAANATITSITPNVSITISSVTTSAGTISLVAAPYGIGDGSTTFNVPNLNGRLPLGQGTSTTTFNMGATGGRDSTTDVPNHVHSIVAGKTPTGLMNYANFAPVPPNIRGTNAILNSAIGRSGAVPIVNARYINLGDDNLPIESSAQDTEINTSGVSSLNIMNPFVAVNYIIFAGV